MTAIQFLIDENAPLVIVEFLRDRGHVAEYVGEAFAKASPDPLLVVAAELHGYVLVTSDKDFRRLIRQLPHGTRSTAEKRAGRLQFTCEAPLIISRLTLLIDEIEHQYARLQRLEKRFIMQISATSWTIVES